ncbi:MAG: pantoate--beta-alanine ligase [Planctomycetaceae bacterium]|nr:pantoate--beta-alanine ligase [Planctomycetaceae bacterium]MBQ2821897.1 pantoate--beta-alanine ligase [Thermoguttaceae bacterium]
MKPKVVRECAELHSLVKSLHRQGLRIGLVPTMGALHAGHISLVKESLKNSDWTIVSIFVNPTQFAPGEDFEKYPRTLESDLALLEAENEKENIIVFTPSADEMYPKNFYSYVDVAGVAQPLEGAFRPTHFRGVATVVLKLFNMTRADVAFFGQKDFQQVQVIRQFVRDLNVPIEIRMSPIKREEDGLAMSSRNRYLSSEARQRALCLSDSLNRAKEMILSQNCRSRSAVEAEIRKILEHPKHSIDYAVIVDPETLLPRPGDEIVLPVAILLAVRVDDTRLIDNLVID